MEGEAVMEKGTKGVVFDLDALNPGTWFNYKGSKDAKVCLRVCAGDDYKEIRKTCSKKGVEYEKGVRYSYEEMDSEAFNEKLWDFCIIDWVGFADKNGNRIECTKENKILLMGKSVAFSEFVADRLERLRKIETEEKETEEKK
jgi:hypothetical protein